MINFLGFRSFPGRICHAGWSQQHIIDTLQMVASSRRCRNAIYKFTGHRHQYLLRTCRSSIMTFVRVCQHRSKSFLCHFFGWRIINISTQTHLLMKSVLPNIRFSFCSILQIIHIPLINWNDPVFCSCHHIIIIIPSIWYVMLV